MSAIANQWTGDGLAEDTPITASNVATAGNFVGTGATWTNGKSTNPAPTVYSAKNHGLRVVGALNVTADIRAAFTASNAARSQLRLTVGDITTATTSAMVLRSSSTARACSFSVDTNLVPFFVTSSSATIGAKPPAVSVGDVLIVDMVAVVDATAPSTTNGRIFGRVKNLTNTSWNSTGEYFVDTGYSSNAGLAQVSQMYAGQTGGGVLGSSTPWDYEFMGVEPITVNSADTSATAAKAYFADAPVASTPLATPVVTLLSKTTPTTVGGTNGTQTISWPSISGASSYDAYVANSSTPAQEDFIRVGTNVTSPYTVTGLAPGTHAYGVKARV